ncbi:RNA 2'-phosphotransferase [Sulfitobacter sp. SK012]|uniref:RNA 2'-phosphotransferase n=1 Tax=Sulfitobacter sp. SK012 TaxID=1389005 RepID=UPI000E0BF169|nr:RNA 2'-phosphotransferase [Sulfitobacter sp. SK012]AXI47910.1 RNA 2'-phosphotransferase [Sulfitobacter sp. SK012]
MSKEAKFLSMALRHKPEEIGLALDKNAWADVDDLLLKMKKAGRKLSRQQLEEIVATNDKQRFTLSPDGTRIRAAQGHSFEVDLGLEPSEPPAALFHGTARSNLDSIFVSGLEAKGRSQVHLSTDETTAKKVGERHGKAVILSVDAERMHNDGFLFYRADNGVWLTDRVPRDYLGFGLVQ